MRYELSFRAGKPETGFILTPLPTGPFIQISQHDPRVKMFSGDTWAAAFSFVAETEVLNNFDLQLGYVVFGEVGGTAQIIGAWYDTSD